MRIVVFGDSISEGFWDYEKGGWVNMFKIYLWKKYGYDKMLMNYGMSAYDSGNILDVFESFFNGSIKKQTLKKDNTVIVSVGINDCSIDIKNNNYIVGKEQFIKNINEIINKCKNNKLITRIVFISNININEEIINDSRKDEDFLLYNKDIKEYNNIIENICDKNNLEFIDLFGIMNKDDLEDGLHPSTKGHIKIFEKVRDYFNY